jgi:hypothetical protein
MVVDPSCVPDDGDDKAGECRYWRPVSQFDSYTVWDHDKVPNELDSVYLRCLDWLQVADEVNTSNK